MMASMPACDLCHTRKVKCDRQDPCMNCVDAQVECGRARQARVHRPRVSRLDALSDRLAKLEKSKGDSIFSSPSSTVGHNEKHEATLSSPQGKYMDTARTCSKRKHPSSYSARDTSPIDHSESKRTASHGIGSNIHVERHSPGSARHASEAREYIEHELQCNPALSKDRRTALELAQRFVNQLSNPGIHLHEPSATEELEVEDIAPPQLTPELLYMMLPGPDKKTNSQGTIVWPDHISDKTLERMGLAILDNSENDQILQLYRIVPLKMHFKTLKRQYEAAAMDELNSVPLTAPPSLTLLQALLSGKRLMQYLGNMPRCWMFTAFASRVIVALNYHSITNTIPQNAKEEEIHACVYTCYYFDSTLSLLLLRPPSLPELKVEPAQLIHRDPELPTTAMIIGIVELAQVKSTLLKILLDTKDMNDVEKANILSDLVFRAQKVYSDLQIYRSRQEIEFPDSWVLLRREWLSVDFNYYSALTTLIRARSSVLKSRLVCEDCLYAARKALTTLRALQEAFSDDETSVDSYPYFLTWTMLLFPLSPFFVLFCNVVATSDHRDFEMIKKITGDLHQFARANVSIGKLYGLFSKFLDLCAPLIKQNPWPSNADHHIPRIPNNDLNDGRIPSQVGKSFAETFGQGNAHSLKTLPSPGTNSTVSGVPPSVPSVEGWDDSLMWELFDNQPSLGWAESELWDAMAQFHAA
ncbi:transcriptional regulator family: Fungal Specific TF [Penicillium angulare]|uniref:Transcriptional regulator family: Fungal Specific TF n=1 Tax=Penicillium angulare TaxID=116970 RepID=A0A9W9GCX9_9EURO|nr:transcriptional regulator family: Fungal Specific TF [Penicillium angulare]